MDLTEGTQEEKQNRSKKMMLWFGIGSLIMTFAGLISAFIVSRKREDWLLDFQLFFYIKQNKEIYKKNQMYRKNTPNNPL